MRRVLILFLAAISFIALQNCEDQLENAYNVKVTTLEATNISIEGYTFNAAVEWSSSALAIAEAGILYSHRPKLSMGNATSDPMYRTQERKLTTNSLTFKETVKNIYHAGETVYYRAYVAVSEWNPKTPNVVHYYGEEKSFVIPEE